MSNDDDDDIETYFWNIVKVSISYILAYAIISAWPKSRRATASIWANRVDAVPLFARRVLDALVDICIRAKLTVNGNRGESFALEQIFSTYLHNRRRPIDTLSRTRNDSCRTCWYISSLCTVLSRIRRRLRTIIIYREVLLELRLNCWQCWNDRSSNDSLNDDNYVSDDEQKSILILTKMSASSERSSQRKFDIRHIEWVL